MGVCLYPISLAVTDSVVFTPDLIATKGQHNIAFTCYHQLGDTASCIELLIKTDRAPEAAFFARSYAPSSASSAVKSWKTQLNNSGKKKLAEALADPEENEDLFDEGWAEALARERGESSTAESSQQNGSSEPAEAVQTAVETVKTGAEAVIDTVGDLAEKVKEVVIDAVEPASDEPGTLLQPRLDQRPTLIL